MVLVFSYGSNSTAQLKSRVENPALVSKGAYVDGYTRIFCLATGGGWRTGSTKSAVASIHPQPGERVYGAVVELNAAEAARLDGFEGGYTKTGVVTSEGHAVAYIANNPAWSEHLPSEHYLVAIHAMLREHFTMDDQTVDIRGVLPGLAEPVVISRWSHPGVHKLTLEGFLVELNIRRGGRWKMPTTIPEVTKKLRLIGVDSTAQLAKELVDRTLNDKLAAADPPQKVFNSDVLGLMASLLFGT